MSQNGLQVMSPGPVGVFWNFLVDGAPVFSNRSDGSGVPPLSPPPLGVWEV